MATNFVQIENDSEIKKRLQAERARLRKIAGLDEPAHFHRPIERAFTAEERSRVTILFGGFTWKHEDLIRAVFQGCGYRCEKLPVPDVPAFQTGKEYGNNGQCNPTYFTVGNLVLGQPDGPVVNACRLQMGAIERAGDRQREAAPIRLSQPAACDKIIGLVPGHPRMVRLGHQDAVGFRKEQFPRPIDHADGVVEWEVAGLGVGADLAEEKSSFRSADSLRPTSRPSSIEDYCFE